jgi:alpha-L-rhamnosidase
VSLEFQLAAANRVEPLGIPTDRGIMLSWSIAGDGVVDTGSGADVEVGVDAAELHAGRGIVWAAHNVVGSTVRYAGPEPVSRGALAWRVVVRTLDGVVASPVARLEAGLLAQADWSASWISAPLLEYRREMWDPLPLLRRRFTLDAAPASARAYATALGIYRLWINGTEVTADSLFRPGWTDYDHRVLHQTYDVTGLLSPGANVVAVELARGWFAGRLGLQREPAFYGEHTAVRLQLEGDLLPLVVTDGQWRVGRGDVLASDLLTGETQDLRQATEGWTDAEFDDSDWAPALVRDDIRIPITAQPHAPVAPYREHEGTLVRAHARGPAVYDFGQNLVGWTRIEAATLPKADVVVRHGELLTPDDLVWRDNLRGAFQEDRFTTGDDAVHRLEPRHTFHGFRFAEVWGLAPEVPFQALQVPADVRVTAISLSGGQAPAGRFECSDPLLTQVSRMAEWTVRDNFLEVITDCPQRDERLGWLGDAGVIAQTAAYHFDIGAFVAKFARDAADSQADDGAIRSYVPPVPPGTDRDGAPGWADGYVRLVHRAAQRYGDHVTAEEHYESIARYLDWIDRANPSGIRTERVGADFSDWLSLPEDPDEPPHPGYAYTGARSTSSKRVVATAHTIRSLDQFADIAGWLGRPDDEARLRERAAEIRAAYLTAFVDERGWIEGDTQTVYAQAIGYGILSGEHKARAVDRLAAKIAELRHVTTGIHGVEHIVPALARNGHEELAAKLLLRDEMPGWKHMAAMGATTVWEKWDGISADGTLATAEMNSLNHCALGAVGEFLFEGVAGLSARDVVRTSAAVIEPFFVPGLDWARAEHDSPAGPIESSWRRSPDGVVHELSIGPSLQAEYRVPSGWQATGRADAFTLGAGRHRVELRRLHES